MIETNGERERGRKIRCAFNLFPDFFVQAFKIIVDSWKFSMSLLYIMRWLTDLYDFTFKWTATAAFAIHPSKSWLSQLVNFKNAIWTWGLFRRMIKFCFKLGKNAAETHGMLQTAFRPSCMNRASILSDIIDSRKAGSLWGMMRGVGGVRKSEHQSWLAKGLGLELLC